MKITNLKINRIINPVGYLLEKPIASFIIDECKGKALENAQIQVALDENFQQIIFDTGVTNDIDSIAVPLDIDFQPYTRYYWMVFAISDNGEESFSDIAFFETGKMDDTWDADFITVEDSTINCDFYKEIIIDKEIQWARVYICGLGVYECYINDRKVGDEYLTPYCNDYESWLQYQTFDITDYFKLGLNCIDIYTGDGWYKGNFGFEGGTDCIYGDKQGVIAELYITYKDGSTIKINTDESWKVKESKIRFSSIYHGEIYDDTYSNDKTFQVVEDTNGLKERLVERMSLPVKLMEVINPIEIIETPTGETVLDMGQNMVGWIEFINRMPKGEKVRLQYGEILQDGNFYRENLREARAEYIYTSDGIEKPIRPFFTFYGFRYVRLEGFEKVRLDDFVGHVLYSEMEQTGNIQTSNAMVNQLISNVLWGQKGNFLDVPTDCPQRDERMGWTGDAQVFAGTAAFQMDVYAFFKKYGFDMGKEQAKRNGLVPMIVPAMNLKGGGSSAWADSATIIPWTIYLYYGDKTILEQQYESMKSWVDYIRRQDEESGNQYLWTVGFHFGDWLAMDWEGKGMPTGATEISFISSSYYYMSTSIVAKAANTLGMVGEQALYEDLAIKIKNAIQQEYFTPNGRLAITTQTAYVLALQFGLVPKGKEQKVADQLAERVKKDNSYLKTGFVGTPYICRVLSDYGYNELAYTLLLNEDCPSWLYQVKMGATTVWERWNSVLEDGHMNPEGMNSLNHYAYGSIVEWMYRYMLGITPVEEKPGFRKIILNPQPDSRIREVKGYLKTAVGTYHISWDWSEGKVNLEVTIPFGAQAEFVLNNKMEKVTINKLEIQELNHNPVLESGTYYIKYKVNK
jgi:alpha-L-rhamnosidase